MVSPTTEFQLSLYDKLESRNGFVSSLQGKDSGILREFPPIAITSLIPGSQQSRPTTQVIGSSVSTLEPTYSFEINPATTPGSTIPWVDLQNCPSSGCSGVYPVEISLIDSQTGRVTGTLSTQMVYFQSVASLAKLAFAWIVPIEHASQTKDLATLSQYPGVSLSVDLEPRVALTASQKAPGATRTSLASALHSLIVSPSTTQVGSISNPSAPKGGQSVTAPTVGHAPPSTPTALSADHMVLGSTFVPVNPVQLIDNNLTSELDQQLQTGFQILSGLFHQRLPESYWVSNQPLTRQGANLLISKGYSNFILPASTLGYVNENLTPTQPWILSGVTPVPGSYVGESDPGLETDLASTNDPILAAHRLFADLVQVWADEPNQTNPPRALVLDSNTQLASNTQFISTLLGILSNNPAITPISLQEYFNIFQAQPTKEYLGQRSLTGGSRQPSLPWGEIRHLRSSQLALAQTFGQTNGNVELLNQDILESEASNISSAQRLDRLRLATHQSNYLASKIRLTGSQVITLTSQSGNLPITLGLYSSRSASVVIRIKSDKLEFPSGDSKSIVLTKKTSTEIFRVKTRTPGEFSIKISVLTPDLTLLIDSSSYTIRSTAFSGVATVLTSGALLLLIVWWIRSIVRTRRTKTPNKDDLQTDELGPQATPDDDPQMFQETQVINTIDESENI